MQIGTNIYYCGEGVCLVNSIEEKEIKGELKRYYVLKPINNFNATIMIPTENEDLVSRAREILSCDEINELINEDAFESLPRIDNKAPKRKIRDYSTIEMIKTLKYYYNIQVALKESGKKFHVNDERMMREFERLLFDEFSFVLKLPKDEVKKIIVEAK